MAGMKDIVAAIDLLQRDKKSWTSSDLEGVVGSKGTCSQVLRGLVRMGKVERERDGVHFHYHVAEGLVLERELDEGALRGVTAARATAAEGSVEEEEEYLEIDPDEFFDQLDPSVLVELITRAIEKEKANAHFLRETLTRKDNELAALGDRLSQREEELKIVKAQLKNAETELSRINAEKIIPERQTRVLMPKTATTSREHSGLNGKKGVRVHGRPYAGPPPVVIHKEHRKH